MVHPTNVQKPFVGCTILTYADRAVRVQSVRSQYRKNDTPNIVFQSHISELLSAFSEFSRIYMDGSKEESAVAAAAVMDSVMLIKLDFFSAEARVNLLALAAIGRSVIVRFPILSDSLSCLQHGYSESEADKPPNYRNCDSRPRAALLWVETCLYGFPAT
jgi:hypothetical protein